MTIRSGRRRAPTSGLVLFGGLTLFAPWALAQQPPAAVRSPPSAGEMPSGATPALQERILRSDQAVKQLPIDVPAFLPHSFHSALSAPGHNPARALPMEQGRTLLQEQRTRTQPCTASSIYDQGGIPATIGKKETDRDPAGCVGSYQPGGATTTGSNAFFDQLGSNGRTCVTCHQPPSGISVNVANINARYHATGGTDAIFAGVDGANCPNNLPPNTGNGAAFRAAHSLLLKRGDIRVFLPVPVGAEFTVEVVSDPYGCNTDPAYNQDTVNGQTAQMVSIYRRPRISANLDFITTFVPPPGVPSGPAIMWDTREPTLASQAQTATLVHAQAQNPPTTAQIAQMVAFENGFFSAQIYDTKAHNLDTAGATGGPTDLSSAPAGQGGLTFTEYNSWAGLHGNPVNSQRAAIARGEDLFNKKTFTISNVAGLNNVSLGGPPNNNITGTCTTCHSQAHAGNNLKGKVAAVDIGIGGGSSAHQGPKPSPDLPIFKVTCTGGKSTPFNGNSVTTNDPGLALISGKCADIGRFSGPQLRALAARAPYFSDGSAPNLDGVVEFYDHRFSIGFKHKEIQDLISFLSSL